MTTMILASRTTLLFSCSYILFFLSSTIHAQSSVRKLAAVNSPHVLNVHVVPHTHDDVGWRKTVEQYFYGWNETIDRRGNVHDIISTAVQALTEHPSRTFTYVESKFFQLWWQTQTPALQTTVRHLIASRQLTFVNGGWCMHDEASTHYMGMIDQTTLGHEFLLHTVGGVIPRTAWQLDPFGHSYTQAKLLTQAVGMDALYFGRIDYQDIEKRRDAAECEGVWDTNAGADGGIFWGLTGSYGGNYGAPEGFCFDVLCNQNEPLVGANTTRIQQRIVDFLHKVNVQANQTKGQHIMLTMGEDFTYREAHVDFSNLDLLIGATMNYQQWGMVNVSSIFGPRFQRVNVFYSNPDYYTEQKHLENIDWPNKTDDFFPYSDCPHCFWTGYFTSRSSFKRYERVASSFLLAARQIDAMLPTATTNTTLFPLEDALGIAQHHDAVSGTAKQHVADDYSVKLAHGLHHAVTTVVAPALGRLLQQANGTTNTSSVLTYCGRLNETLCDPSQQYTGSSGTFLYVVAYNALAQNRSTTLRLPMNSSGTYLVRRWESPTTSTPIETILVDNHKPVLIFSTGSMPAMGGVVFRISKDKKKRFAKPTTTSRVQRRLLHDSVTINNGLVNASFDRSTGLLIGISSGATTLRLNQTWGYYTSFDSSIDEKGSNTTTQNSGAYIFRPTTDQIFTPLLPRPNQAKFVNTPVGMEVHAKFQVPWIQQVTRINTDQQYVELEYTVGPIPIGDGRGKEIVSRLVTPDIQSRGLVYTDSNGRDFLRRQRDARPSWKLEVHEPVAGNYYPVNAAIYIQDNKTNSSLAVIVDRSQGGASLQDGSIELMVQRRTVADDARGVDEALNETDGGMTPYPPFGRRERVGDGVIVRGTHRIAVGGAAVARSVMDDAFASVPVFLLQSNNPELFDTVQSFSGLVRELPPNVMLMTFRRLATKNEFMVRLGHQYGPGESSTLSAPVTVDLGDLFKGYKVTSIKEKTLTANQDLSAWRKRRLSWTKGASVEEGVEHRTPSLQESKISLTPLLIRTFVLTLERN